MKFQFRLMTLVVAVITLGMVVGANVRTKWSRPMFFGNDSEGGDSDREAVAYGWPLPFFFTEFTDRPTQGMKIAGVWRMFGPGIELDLLFGDVLFAGVLILGACHAVKILQRQPKKESSST
jgi:hypothetical protein